MSKVKFECYNCGEPVGLGELLLVDLLVEDLDEEKSESLADMFSHCTGPTYKFHDSQDGSGIANLCNKCFHEIIN